jgi:hypothetical protein
MGWTGKKIAEAETRLKSYRERKKKSLAKKKSAGLQSKRSALRLRKGRIRKGLRRDTVQLLLLFR